jgi:hypothetical protein
MGDSEPIASSRQTFGSNGPDSRPRESHSVRILKTIFCDVEYDFRFQKNRRLTMRPQAAYKNERRVKDPAPLSFPNTKLHRLHRLS